MDFSTVEIYIKINKKYVCLFWRSGSPFLLEFSYNEAPVYYKSWED